MVAPMLLIVIGLFLASKCSFCSAIVQPVVPYKYPEFRQCNESWSVIMRDMCVIVFGDEKKI